MGNQGQKESTGSAHERRPSRIYPICVLRFNKLRYSDKLHTGDDNRRYFMGNHHLYNWRRNRILFSKEIVRMSLDLKKYGIDLSLTEKTALKKLDAKMLSPAKIQKNYYGDLLEFSLPSGRYNIVKKLGEGSYGAAYEVLDKSSNIFVVKSIKVRGGNTNAVLKESLIHILLMEESKNETNGPYVPVFYEMGYDKKEDTMLLRIELLDKTFDHIIRTNTKDDNDKIVPNAIAYLAKILQFFSERLAFNHRDLKGDNIMYKRMPNGKVSLKLIDFGLSCLTWKGLEVRGEGYSGLKQCYKKDRDLSQFLYSIARYEANYISDKLYDRIGRILQANVNNNHTCAVLEDCDADGIKNWHSSYNFFNRSNVNMPYGEPEFVRTNMKAFVVGEPFKGAPIVLKKAPVPDKKKNKTKKAKGEKACGPGQMRNPATGRCKKIPLPITSIKPKECPPGKVLNPKTNRCVRGLRPL